MITFKQFLSEEEKRTLKEMLEQDCGPFLQAAKGAGFLYRGIQGLIGDMYVDDGKGEKFAYTVKQVRKDRRPLDLTKERSKIIDDWFKEKFDIRARSECVFAFGEKVQKHDINHYGKPCIIFPIGKIRFVWSPAVEDMFGQINIYPNDKPEFEGPVKGEDDLKARLRYWLDQSEYQTSDLAKAIGMPRSHEIMIECDSYYAFSFNYRDELKAILE